MLRFHALVAALSVCLFLNNAAFAQFVPPDLNPGDMYHLVFVTEGTADALVGKEINEVTLADYDAFVQAEAAMNPALTGTDQGIQYRAIVTAWEEPHGEETTARDHTAVKAAVYRFDGERVADGEEDMWDGELIAPISINLSLGFPGVVEVWTGTLSSGSVGFCGPPTALGGVVGGLTSCAANTTVFNQPMVGTWVGVQGGFDGWSSRTFRPPLERLPFYAISDPLTVPIPEPTSSMLMLMGIVAMGHRKRRGV